MPTIAFEFDLLWSLALCVDFPHALAERNFRDYFDHSVTMYLAVFRSTPSSSKCLGPYVGPHFVIPRSLRVGLQRELEREILPFPFTSSTGDSTVSCGLAQFRPDLGSNYPVFTLYGLTDEHLIPGTGISLAFIPACSFPPVPFGRRYLRPLLRANKPLCYPHCSSGPASLRERRLWHRGALLLGFRRHAGILLFRRSHVFDESKMRRV
jgi:hypothetical protein